MGLRRISKQRKPTPMKLLVPLRFVPCFLRCIVAVFALGAAAIKSVASADEDEFKRPTIEAAQRAIQERYVTWFETSKANGADLEGFPDKIVWPALMDGTPAGDYPEDCFYDKDLFDEKTGQVKYPVLCFLVADVANKVSSYLLSEAYVPPQFLGRISGLEGIPILNPPQFPGTQVNPYNYSDFFAIACAAIKERSYPWVDIYPTGSSDVINEGGETREGFAGVESTGSDCSDATASVLSYWLSLTPTRTPFAKVERSDAVAYSGSGYWNASVSNIKGRYGFDHSAFGRLGGSAEFYIRQFDPNLARYGVASTVPLTAANAPFPRYREEYKIATISLASGAKYFSAEYGNQSLTFESPCSSASGSPYSAGFGYALSGTVVVSPDYKYRVDTLVSECHTCKTCKQGHCTNPGATNFDLHSISYHVGLGNALKGSAGSASIYSPSANFLLASPLGLEIAAGEGTVVIADSDYEEIPRQIVTPQGLVDIRVDSPFKRYVMRFFDKASQGAKSGKYYQPVAGAEYKTIQVENPGMDAAAITGTVNLSTSNFLIRAPGHNLTPGTYYAMRVDAVSGALPEGWTIGRLSRRNLYYIYAYDASSLALLYWNASNQPAIDTIKDSVPGQVLKISSPFPFNNLVITETTASTSHSFNYTYTTPSAGVALAKVVETTGSRVRSRFVSSTTVDPTHVTEVAWEQDGGENIITKTMRKYRIFPWNFGSAQSKSERQTLVEELLDPDGVALKSSYTYNEDSVNGGVNYSRLQQIERPNGSWERYEYDSAGDAVVTYASYLDAPPSSDASTCRLITQTSAPGVDIADLDGDGIGEKLESTVEKILGNEVGRSYELTWSGTDSKGRRKVSHVRCLEPGAVWDASSNVRTDSWSYVSGPNSGRLAKLVDESGILSLYNYSLDGVSGTETTTVERGIPDGSGEAVTKGTRTVTIVSATGSTLDVTTSDISSSIILSRQYTPPQYVDEFGRTTRVNYADGTFVATVYEDCCGALTTIDRDGTSTRREQDASGFVTKITRAGIAERFVEGYTTTTMGGVPGFTRTTYRAGRGLPEVRTNVETYDKAGRLVATLDPRDGVDRLTQFTEGKNANGRWTRTTASPDANTRTSLFYLDGATKEELDSGVSRTRFEYGVESSSHDGKTFNARTSKQILVGAADTETEWSKEFTDPLGRSYRTEWPDSAGQSVGIAALSFFDSAGRLVRQVDADGVTTLFERDPLGDTQTQALDINRNGLIDLAGPDRVQRTRRTVLNLPSKGDVVQTTTEVWEQLGSDQPTIIAISEQSTDGADRWETSYGLTSHSHQSYEGGGVIQRVTTQPDDTVQTTSTQKGTLVTQKSTHPSFGTLAETVNTVDGLDRIATSTDALSGAVTTITYYDTDLLRSTEVRESTTSSAQKTEYLYDNMNRLTTTILPNNTRTEARYSKGGNVRARFGANTLPVEYTYDRQDRMSTMTTWQHFDDAAESGLSGAAVTTWIYNARGQLRQKRDNAGLGPKYTYTPGGRLRTREWARTGTDGANPILTTYGYSTSGASDANVETGDVLGIYYTNDPSNTPQVENAYNRLGQLETVTDASGRRQLSYENGSLDTETYSSDPNGTSSLFAGYVIDREFDALHRYAGVVVKDASAVEIYRVGYQNDAASRLGRVDFEGKSVTYTYAPASSTRVAMDYKNGGQSFFSVAQNFDALNRLTSRVSTASTATKSVTYEFDALNRRKKAKREDGAYWDYDYDGRGQLNSAVKKDSAGAALPGGTFAYQFDDIGNRVTSSNDGLVSHYTANLLNQYVETISPLAVDVTGSADPAAEITVDGIPVTTRNGREFSTKIDANAGANGPAHWRTIEITGILEGGGVNGANRTATETRDIFVPQSPSVSQHDADGNLIEDDKWHYYWDAENRLSAIEGLTARTEPITGSPIGGRKRLEFSYDSAGSRVTKKVFNWDSASSHWAIDSYLGFNHDGCNLLLELDQLASGYVVRSYAWGSDLDGALQSAGGVGGLVLASERTKLLAPIYDGNGNVVATIDDLGLVRSDLEYTPFGQLVSSVPAAPDACPFGCSTKYTDSETSLVYYGRRYYSPLCGRWIFRDPIDEEGGANLYEFVANVPIGVIDPLGEYGRDVHGFFTYFMALAAGASVHDARALGAYTWGPDAAKKTNAIDVIYTDIGNTFEIQSVQHGLTGNAPEPLRIKLLANIPNAADDFGRWSHVFEDSYAHVQVKHALLTAFVRKLGVKAEYKRGDRLYSKGLGHALSGTIPDQVSTSPGMFVEMANSYFEAVSRRFGGQLTPAKFREYAVVISGIPDPKREEFIRYVLRPCKSDDVNSEFDRWLDKLPRLGLDPTNKTFNLPKGSSLKDWNQVKNWVAENIKNEP